MKHVLTNLLLLPLRLAWDALLLLAVVLIAIFCLGALISLFGFLIFLVVVIGEPVTLLLPFMPLLFLKHPWPPPASSDLEDESQESSGGKLIHAVLL